MQESSVGDNVPTTWLYRRVTVEEAERIHSDPDSHGGRAFGASHDAWKSLKASLTAADEVWIYDSRKHIATGACANYGVCAVRHGRVVRHLLLRIG